MPLSLSDIDAELARRQQAGGPSLDEIDAELTKRGVEQSSFGDVAMEAAKTALTQGPIQTPLNLIDPENTQKMNEVLGTPMRGIRGALTAATSGIQRGAEAVQPEFKPQGLGEHVADIAANIADPRQMAFGPVTEAAMKGAVTPLFKALGRTAARVPNIMAGVPAEDVMMAAEKPLEVLASKSPGAAGKLFGAAKKAAGVSDVEERLIAGIGDPSGYKRVADQLYEKGVENLTTGELLAWKKAASELARKVKGSGEALYTQDALKAQAELGKRAAEDPAIAKVLSTQADVALSKAKDKFLSIFPRNKGKGDAVLRGMLQLGSGIKAGPAAALFSPISYLPPTLAAGAANKGLNVIGNNPAVRQALMGLLTKLQGQK